LAMMSVASVVAAARPAVQAFDSNTPKSGAIALSEPSWGSIARWLHKNPHYHHRSEDSDHTDNEVAQTVSDEN
jgi:hypothetical protein